MGKYFGTDGYRGHANVNLTADRAFAVGRYLGYYYGKDRKNKILIGKDTRLSSDMLEHALASGIASQGCDVYLLGYCPTPVVAYLTRKQDFICGAMISASHNPYYDNGIKIFSKEGIKLSSDVENLIEDYLDGKVEIAYATDEHIGKVIAYPQGIDDYLQWIHQSFDMDLSNYKIAVDCANGASSVTAEKALSAFGAKLTMIHNEPDGVNINTKCGSTHPESLQEIVRQGTFDLGLTFDGDADRQILVSPSGELLTGDHMLYIAGKYLKQKGELENNTVVTTVMANLGLFKAMEKENIRLVQTQVGDKYVYEKMCQENDVVGGEQSGHIIFSNLETTGDGLVTALMMLQIMYDTKQPIQDLARGLTIYPQLLVNVRVANKDKAMQDKEILDFIEQENQSLNGNGRILVRSSGTEPLVRVMAEAETDQLCEEIVGRIAKRYQEKYGI